MSEHPVDQSPKVTKLNIRTVPFADQERRVERANAERAAAKEAEKKRAEFEAKVRVTEHLTGRLPREGMAPVFFAAARRVAMEVLLGNIPVRNGSEAGTVIASLMAAGRAEMGQSIPDDITSPPRTREEAEKRMRAIQDELAKRRAEMNPASGE